MSRVSKSQACVACWTRRAMRSGKVSQRPSPLAGKKTKSISDLRPVIKTEDVSGIEKSGLRSMLDKKSDEVRKGLAKTFAFGRKKDKIDLRSETGDQNGGCLGYRKVRPA